MNRNNLFHYHSVRYKLIDKFKDKKWILYGELCSGNNKTYYLHMSKSIKIVKLYGGENPMHKLELSVHENQSKETDTSKADYHGWIDFNRKNDLCMVWPSQMQSEMCFPYGSKAEEEVNKGIKVRLNVKVLD